MCRKRPSFAGLQAVVADQEWKARNPLPPEWNTV